MQQHVARLHEWLTRWRDGCQTPPCHAPTIVSPQQVALPITLPEIAAAAAAAASSPQQPKLRRTLSNSGVYRVFWNVQASVVTSGDNRTLSPPFDVKLGFQEAHFRLMLFPQRSDGRRSSFRKARGKGFIHLKC